MSEPRLSREDVDRRLRRLGSVPELAMRVALWREWFDAEEAADLLTMVQVVLAGVVRRSEGHRLAYIALLTHLAECRGRDYPPRRGLYEVAHMADDESVMRLLRTPPSAKIALPAELQVPILDPDREVTLGERRSLARKPDRNTLVRLLADPDPGVVTNLLRNSHLTEPDVLRLVSRRPVSAAVVSLVFRHPKWGRVPEVQRALVLNPYTPVDVALGLVSLLPLAEIRQLARDPQLPTVVRDRAREQMLARDLPDGEA